MGIKFTSKFSGALVVQHQLSQLMKGMLIKIRSTNAQENGMKSFNVRTNKFAEVCMQQGLHGGWPTAQDSG
eukprot:1161961-Pelagomonas_calceolata.AAC.2